METVFLIRDYRWRLFLWFCYDWGGKRYISEREKELYCSVFFGLFYSVVEVFTGYMIFAFMALLFLQVLMRFIFKHPIYGIDECVTALMIWSMCLGWCTVYWDNGHAVLEFIMNRMPKAFRRGMFTFTNFLIVVISWVYIPASWQLFQMQKKMPPVGGLPISKGYYYALPVLVMGVIMLVMSAYKAIAFVITGDESICVPVEKEGGGLLD